MSLNLVASLTKHIPDQGSSPKSGRQPFGAWDQSADGPGNTRSFSGSLTIPDFIYLRKLFYLHSLVYLLIEANFFFGDQNSFQSMLNRRAGGKREKGTGIVPKSSAHSQH